MWLNAHPEALGAFNHPGAGPGANLTYHAAGLDGMFSIEAGNGSRDSYRRYETQYPSALSKGWHVAPTNNSDNESTAWADLPHRVGVIAPALTRANLIEAMRNRRVFSTEDKNLALALQSNGAWMGSTIVAQSIIPFTITVKDPEGESIRLELYENGKLVWSQFFSGAAVSQTVSIAGSSSHYYYVRAVQNDGDVAYSAPLWTDATVVATATATRVPFTPKPSPTPTRTQTQTPAAKPTALPPTPESRENKNDLGWVSIETARTTELFRIMRLEGCITVPPGVLSDRYVYIQDATGGIRVCLSARHGNFPQLGVDTRVSLRGRTVTTLGERAIEIESPTELTRSGTCTTVPKVLRSGDVTRQMEGTLIQVMGALQRTNPWILNDGSGDLEVRTDPDSRVRLATFMRGQRLSIAGIVMRYQTRTVLTPRFKTDVVLIQPSSPTPTRTVARITSPTPSRTPTPSLTPTIRVPSPTATETEIRISARPTVASAPALRSIPTEGFVVAGASASLAGTMCFALAWLFAHRSDNKR